MADSKLRKTDVLSADDLVRCGICFAVLDKPKALPCIHTYCQQCLTSWAESSAKKNPEKYSTTIVCPECREEFPLPKGGVKELKTNFFANKLKEHTVIQKKLNDKDADIPCTSCDSTVNTVIGRCVECDDFLCTQCVDNHKGMRGLRHHHIRTLEELRAGKLAMHDIPDQKICPKHSGEVLRFYCETCDEPICRDCTVLDHPRPDHIQTDLKSAATERSEKLKTLLSQTDQVPYAIKLAIADDTEILVTLEINAQKAIEEYKAAAKKAEEEYTKRIQEMVTNKEKGIDALVNKRKHEIKAHQDSLQCQCSRLRTALEMTSQVTENGSEHDVASMYSSLADTMQQLGKLNPKSVSKTMGTVAFTPIEDLNHEIGSLGVLRTYEQWTLDKKFGQGLVSSGRDIAVDTNGNIMVATYNSGRSIKVFGDDGAVKMQFDTYPSSKSYDPESITSYPWGMELSKEGKLYVTDQNPSVKVINTTHGTSANRFVVQHPNGSSSQNSRSKLHGIAADTKGHLYVGCTNQNYISICDPNGKHVSSFQVNLSPWFIAVVNEDHIIASSHTDQAVHVYDAKGTQRHTFEPPPEGQFYPSGLCVDENEVFVASYQGIPAVYCYTLTGKYLAIVTNDVTSPWGIFINHKSERLVVWDDNCLKVFSPSI